MGAAIVAVILSAFVIKEDVRSTPERYSRVPETVESPADAIDRLAKVLAIPTLANSSAPNHIGNPAPFQQLHTLLESEFPAAYRALKVEHINDYSLLMTWEGSDPSLRPLLLLSHLDVVPAPDGVANAPRNWTHGPFTGTKADGFIWGRGALDTKVTLVGILEAVTQLLGQGFKPQRTVMLAFGHDEEVGGRYGAHAIASELSSRGIEAEMVLDEGGMVLQDGLGQKGSWIKVVGPIALVGTAEKGLQNWKVAVNGVAGHSSVPPTGQGTSVAARLGRVLNRLESELTVSTLQAPTTDFLKALGDLVRWRAVGAVLRLAEHPLVNPILAQLVAGSPMRELAAMVRTTVAVVGINAGGIAHNVLPAHGTITLNMRTLPGEDTASVKQYLDVVLQKEGKHATAQLLEASLSHAAHVTPARGPSYDLIVRAIQESLTPVSASGKGGSSRGSNGVSLPVLPYLVTGMTDSRWYQEVAPGRVFRFSPICLDRGAGDLDRIHGVDERISEEGYLGVVEFYMRFMRLGAGETPAT